MTGAPVVQESHIAILTFLTLFVHRGRASFCLRKCTSREFPPVVLQEGQCGFYYRFAGILPLQRDFDKYLGAFHRLRLNCHLALKQFDPFLHAADAHPFCSHG